MNKVKTLGTVILSAIGLFGCENNDPDKYRNPEYHFNGEIGTNNVRFYEEDSGRTNILEVTQQNGAVLKYLAHQDEHNNFKLYSLEITVDGVLNEFSRASSTRVSKRVLNAAQERFDSLLMRISKKNRAELTVKN